MTAGARNDKPVRKIRLMGHSAQRHKGGVRRTADSGGVDCHSGLIHPAW